MSLFGSGKPRKAKIEIVDPWDEVDEGEEDEEETDLDTMRQQVADWENAWMETPGYSALTEAQREDANGILDFFTDQMLNYHDASPEEWNVHAMEECCLETLPRKMSAEEDYFRAVSPVLASFFTYLGETGLQRHGLEMAKHVGKLDRKIVAASNDPRYWGPAKSLAMAAMKQGVDLTDDRAMEAFVQQYNANIMGGSHPPDMFDDLEDPWDGGMDAGTFVREGPKVGRNDPCSCGSGKKYKKCCGSL